MRDLRAIVLAAGMGKRLGSETTGIPKVMRTANGKPLLKYVLDALSPKPEDTIIVVGYKKETVMEAFSEYQFAVQERQLGTGDAVKAAEPNIDDDFEGSVLVCYGDMPLFKRETYDTLVEVHNAERNIVTILTGIYPEQMPFGRIIRDSGGGFERIVEAKDSDAEIDKIREYNAGIYVFEKAALFDTLGRITTNNA
ncbi:MAG: NTP transferase domain-containing protein, partial [Oscillospiraceae bacterium]|nr:NTP transferase domain-containing protein [Oscillospiraceae bacterium]